MIVGDRVPLTVTVRGDDGQVVEGLSPPVFVSRNPSVVWVDSTGLASATHVGSTLVVVTETAVDRTLSDSIQIGVSQVVGDVSGRD